jgi:hypothetical protein
MRQLIVALGAVSALAIAGPLSGASAQTAYNPPGYGPYNPPGYTNPPGYGPGNPVGYGY